jgi:hypothetical protein
MDLVDEDVQAQKVDAHNRLKEKRRILDAKRQNEIQSKTFAFDSIQH